MRGQPLANAIAAAQSFTGAAGAEDHVGVVAFGQQRRRARRGSSSPARHATSSRGMTVDSKSGTALYDAIVVSARQPRRADDRPGRAIVVVTDGDGCLEPHYARRGSRRRAKAHAAVYTIGIAGPASPPRRAASWRPRPEARTGRRPRRRARSDYAGLARRARADMAALVSHVVAPGAKVDVDGGGRAELSRASTRRCLRPAQPRTTRPG